MIVSYRECIQIPASARPKKAGHPYISTQG
jgi:hypothetical protein